MQHKNETQHLLTNFFSFVKTQFNTSIAKIRVDNAGGFFSMRDFFPIKWHHLSTLLRLYTPTK
jgi:hypothetical protein